jgi:hypothetical protein
LITVLAGQTDNSAYYCGVLWGLHDNVLRHHPELWQQKNWLLHHNNAPSHTSFLTREYFTKNNITVLTASVPLIEDKTEVPSF